MDFHRVLQTLGRSFDTQNTRYGVIGWRRLGRLWHRSDDCRSGSRDRRRGARLCRRPARSPGIRDPALLARIFQPSARGDRAGSSGYRVRSRPDLSRALRRQPASRWAGGAGHFGAFTRASCGNEGRRDEERSGSGVAGSRRHSTSHAVAGRRPASHSCQLRKVRSRGALPWSWKRVSELPDLERDLPTTEEDVRTLRALRNSSAPDFLTYLKILSEADLSWCPTRRRPLRCPEPFEL